MNTFLVSGMILSLVFSFFFSVMERVYFSANKLQLEIEGRLGRLSGKIISFFAKHPSWFIGTTYIGSTVSLVALCTFAALWLVPMQQTLLPEVLNNGIMIIMIQTIFSTILILLTSVLLPRIVRRFDPNRLLASFTLPFTVCFIFLFILMYPVVAISEMIMIRLFKKKNGTQSPFVGFPELNQRFKEMYEIKPGAAEDPLDKKIFRNALAFKNVKIRDCMIPRTDIIAVEIDDSIKTLRDDFIESGHSKIVVYHKSIDEIIGYCHSSSLFKNPEKIKDILTPIIIVAETTLANELMLRFISERKSLAVVVDEFGGTAGLVSMEDVIEQIFGKIEDEHDEEDQQIEQKLDEQTFLLSARLDIDYLNEKYHWNLPAGEYETLGGLILSHIADFPRQGQTIAFPPFTFIIQTTGQNRIGTVLVKVDQGVNTLP